MGNIYFDEDELLSFKHAEIRNAEIAEIVLYYRSNASRMFVSMNLLCQIRPTGNCTMRTRSRFNVSKVLTYHP